MSIREEILRRTNEGRLRQLLPRLSADPCIRRMYLTSELYEDLYKDRSNDSEIRIFAELEADLELFVISETLDSDYLTLLRPETEGVWEIRSTRPTPQIRVFGMFAARDCFIATNYADRDYLGDADSYQWKNEIRLAKETWRNLFPGYTHMKTRDRNRLFSGGLNEQYFRGS